MFSSAPVSLLFFALFLIPASATSCRIQPPYTNISLIKIVPPPQQLATLTSSLRQHCEIRLISDIPTLYPSIPNLLLVTPAQLHSLQQCDCSLQIISGDLSLSIPQWPTQKSSTDFLSFQNRQAGVMDTQFYTQYRTYEALLEKQDQIARDYPQFVTRQTIGLTFEGRPIYAFFIGSTDDADPKRVLLNGMQHAREWVSTVVPHYIIEFLCVSLANNDPVFKPLLKRVQLIVVPLVNSDGYVYSRTTDRFWRKNRRTGTGCEMDRIGVDLNRNWDLDYGGDGATSTNPCSDVFIGDSVFSEPETSALRDLVVTNRGIKAHVDFHSFGQLVLGAWAFTDEQPPRVDIVDTVGFQLERRMTNSSLNRYRYGRGGSGLIYFASGVMQDWVFAQDILSYTIELRPDTLSSDRFHLEEKFLVPTSREGVEATRALIEFADDPQAFLDNAEPPLTIDGDEDGLPIGTAEPDSAPSPTPIRSRGGNTSVGIGVIVSSAIASLIAVSVIIGVIVFRIRSRQGMRSAVP